MQGGVCITLNTTLFKAAVWVQISHQLRQRAAMAYSNGRRSRSPVAPRTRSSSRSVSGSASCQQSSQTLRGQAISGMSPYEERVLRALRRTISGSPGETVVFEAADTELRRLRRLLELSMQETDRAAASADTRLRQLQRRLANANEQNAGLLSELVRLRVAVLACGCGAAFRSWPTAPGAGE